MFIHKFIQPFARDDVHDTSSDLRDSLIFQRGEDAFKNPFAVVAAEQRFADAF